MPSFETLMAFIAAAAVFAYMPGPAMLYAAAQTAVRGRRAGLMASLGIHIGGYFHVVLAAAGLSALLAAVPALYAAVKIAGAAYLIWLGVTMMLGAKNGAHDPAVPARSARRAFVDSVVVEVLNPKAAMFFVAFLPQFADPAASLPVWGQLLVLGTIVNLMFSSADLVCVFLSGAVLSRLKRSGPAQRIVRAMGGAVLVVLGVRLATREN